MATCVLSAGSGYTSMMSDEILPPAISFTNKAARLITLITLEISTPFSNLAAASVLKPCLNDVLRMLMGSNHAHSIKMSFVLSVTPLFAPPKTPAIHMASPSVLHIMRSSLCSFLSFSSNVVNGVS